MLVTRDGQSDTIGGGHLEMRACEIAREMLALPVTVPAAVRRVGRFALGPSLGQCCGGVVHLSFERIMPDDATYYAMLEKHWSDRQDCWRLIPLDGVASNALIDDAGNCLAGLMPALPVEIDQERPCHVMKDGAGHRWLIDPCLAYRPHLVLFGAGHVGAAIVRSLADMPCHVTWVDEREDMFPAVVPANVRIEATDMPEAVVDEVPSGSTYLVLTHSHALDQRLSEAILRRSDAGWFGLIGSKTKRMQFEHRLRDRGIPQERIAGMVCPIGVPASRASNRLSSQHRYAHNCCRYGKRKSARNKRCRNAAFLHEALHSIPALHAYPARPITQ
ncbi:xanthine dehydrogenase accessory protein XdhC [Noviherbaspirillum saxi]|uniref:xanthine dehydrogenase accessory protein XdhC n=1 Tax=Noviherbaspirillum saxi TaxID=2320863 RepID=UPI0026D52703